MKFIDWFAGIGGFRRGLELAGHECVGVCEFDKFANASYRSMHTITDEQREHLATLDLKKRQKEILKEEYLNGEWFAEDVRTVNSADVPRADVWCFGFPCQDISICGKQGGLKQNRSGLFYRIIYLLEQTPEEKDPSSCSLRMLKICCLLIEDGTSPDFSLKWTASGMMQSGRFSTPKTSESRRIANGCTLSDVLERDVPAKYFVSTSAGNILPNED